MGGLPASVGCGRGRGRRRRARLLRARERRRVSAALAPGHVVPAPARAGRARARVRRHPDALGRGVRVCRGRGLRARRRASDLRDLPLDPVRGLSRGALAVDAAGPACGPHRACALAVPAALFMLWLAPIAADTVSVSPSAGRGEARARAVPRPARRALDLDQLQPRARGLHARRADRDRRAPPDPARRVRVASAVVGLRRRRLAGAVRRAPRAAVLHRALGLRLDLAGAARGRVPARSRSPSPEGSACSRAWSGPGFRRSRSWPAPRSSGSTRATSTIGSKIPGRSGSSGSQSWGRWSRSWSGSCGATGAVRGLRRARGRALPRYPVVAVGFAKWDPVPTPPQQPALAGPRRGRARAGARSSRSSTRTRRRATGSRRGRRSTSRSRLPATSRTRSRTSPSSGTPTRASSCARATSRSRGVTGPSTSSSTGCGPAATSRCRGCTRDPRYVLYRLPAEP